MGAILQCIDVKNTADVIRLTCRAKSLPRYLQLRFIKEAAGSFLFHFLVICFLHALYLQCHCKLQYPIAKNLSLHPAFSKLTGDNWISYTNKYTHAHADASNIFYLISCVWWTRQVCVVCIVRCLRNCYLVWFEPTSRLTKLARKILGWVKKRAIVKIL